MITVAAPPADRFGAFVRTQLAPNPPRVRAFLRTEVGLLLATFVVVTFKPSASYWIVVYLLLVSAPIVGNSLLDAFQRFYASVVACAVAVLVIIVALDEPWLYRPLQAILIGFALFIARGTPLGAMALTGGATFAIITGSDVGEDPEGLITLSFYRILHAVIGSGIGAFVQMTFWSDDPLDVLKLSLRQQIDQVEAALRGEPVSLDAARVARNFELLANAQVRHPELLHRRTEIAEVIIDTAIVVDATIRQQTRLGEPTQPLLDEAHRALRRFQAPELYKPPPPPPEPPVTWRLGLHESMAPIRRAAIKIGVAAFIAALFTQVLGIPSAGALFTTLAIGMEVTSGTTSFKPLLMIGGVALGFAVIVLVVKPWMPNLDDPGSLLLLAAVAFAPTAWMTIGGPRVRNGGVFGTVLVAIALFQDFRPVVDLEAMARFALSLTIGPLVVALVDRVIWPVDARRDMVNRAVLMMRDVAALYREPDPRVVLAPNRKARWRAWRNLVAFVQLRSERVPLPGTPGYELEEEALRLVADAEHLLVARIHEARRDLEVAAPTTDVKPARDRTAAALEASAEQLANRATQVIDAS
jgi:uncharacterized membrane protein YccC